MLQSKHPMLLAALLALIPLFFGGNIQPVWWSLLIATGILLWRCNAVVPMPTLYKLCTALFFAVCGWGLVQAVPVAIQFAHPIWYETQAALGGMPLWNSISVHPVRSVLGALWLLPYPVLCYVAYQNGKGSQGVWLLKAFVWSAIIYSMYGLLMLLTPTQYVLWEVQPQYIGNVTGPFLNRNSFATYIGMAVLTLLMLTARNWHNRPRARNVWYVAGLLLLCVTLLLTASRAGVFCTVVGGVVFGLFYIRQLSFKIAVLGGCILAVLLAFAGSLVLSRSETLGEDIQTRLAIYENTAQAVAERPLLGTGLGSFEGVYQQFHTLNIPLWKTGRVDHAHNTGLEVLLELGMPAASVLLLVWLGLLYALCQGVKTRRSSLFPPLGIAIWIQVSVHSLVDFSLEMAGVAVTFVVLMGVCLRHCTSGKELAQPLSFWPKKSAILYGFIGICGLILAPFPQNYPLTQQPLQTDIWLQQAQTSQNAADYYMSFVTAPISPSLYYPRFYLLGQAWPHFSEDEKRLFAPYIQQALRDENQRFWRRVAKYGGTQMMLEGAFYE